MVDYMPDISVVSNEKLKNYIKELTSSSKISDEIDLLKNGYAKLPITIRDNNFLRKLSKNPNVVQAHYIDKNTIISNTELFKIYVEIKKLTTNPRKNFSRKFFAIDEVLISKKFNK